MELPQGSPSKLSLAPSQGSQRGGFCRSCSLPWGLWCFFIPGKETPCPSAAQPENLHPSGQGQAVRHAALPLERISLPLGLALGSPNFPSGCEGKLGVALESLQGLRDLT